MIKAISYNLWILIKNIGILLLFLALTFLLLESIKYYQNKDKYTSPEFVIVVDDSVTPVVVSEESFVEEFFDMMIEEAEAAVYIPEHIEISEAVEVIVPEPEFLPFPQIEEPVLKEKNGDDDYKLYEEELPQDIIVESGIHKDIKDIKVEPTQKPPYFGIFPVIAIIIDDMGISKKRTKDINSLEYPLTSSFLTYGDDLHSQMAVSLKSGHEVIAHIPMEAKSKVDTAPDVLQTTMSSKDIIKRLNKMIDKFDNIKGVNNHMGSKFTENKDKMYDIMKVLKKRDLFFLDSRTSNKSMGQVAAEKYDVSYVTRNIFLDNENDLNYILGQLRATEKVALKKGYAIAIGHPKTQTYAALKQWLPTLEKRGFKLVHLSEIVDVLNKHKENTENK